MKIAYIKLENFIGIYNGSGRLKFELDFTKTISNNVRVLLSGPNGCGKTTLLSCLHPFSGTMDGRSEIILPDRDGYKEIHFIKGEDKYIIKHHYLNKRKNKVIKSFIAKNDEELNPNGTVKSFEEIIERELDVTPSFFVLSRIGSNVKNFIGMKTSERKNYMTNFLPDISEYLFYYKKINEKYLYNSKKIKSVVAEINKLDNEENLNASKVNIEANLKRTKVSIDNLFSKINKDKGVLTTLDSEKILNEYNTIIEKISKLENNQEVLKENFIKLEPDKDLDDLSLEEEIENINKTISDGLTDLNALITKIALVKENIINNSSALENYNVKQEELKKELNSYNIEKSLDELLSLEEELTNESNKIKSSMESLPDKYKLNVEENVIHSIIAFINHLKEDPILSLDVKDIFDFVDNYETYNKAYLNEELDKLKSSKRSLKDRRSELTKKINFNTSKQYLTEVLEKRPDECSIDNCVFISEALKYKNIAKIISKEEEELLSLNEELEEVENNEKSVERIFNTYTSFKRLYKEVKSFVYIDILKALIPDVFNTEKNFVSFLTIDKNYFTDEFKNALEYSHLYMDMLNNHKLLEGIKNDIEIYRSKGELIDRIESELYSTTANINALNKTIKENKDSFKALTDEETALDDIININKEKEKIYKLYIKVINSMSLYKEKEKNLTNDVNKINKLNDEISVNTREHESLVNYYEELNRDYDDIKYKITRLQEFKKDLKELNETNTNVEIIRKALSPTKGIPLLFVDVYLKITKNLANNLLNMAYHGKLYIEDFELTDTDFFIRVVKEDGIPVKDVTLCSQGEMSLIGLAISLAMIQQAKRSYNIILLDEVDKELDSSNRRYFIDILNAQLKALKIEQCFIISHNKEFDNAELDLILFEGHDVDITSKEFMNGKNILK